MKKIERKQTVECDERPPFDSTREPVAAPGHMPSRAWPAERKVKHTRRPGDAD